MTPVEMLGLTEFPAIGELPYFLTLPGYGFYWFRLQQSPSPITARVPHEAAAPVGEAPALFMGVAWDTLLDGNVRTLIERDLLGAVPAAAALVRRQGAPGPLGAVHRLGRCCGAAPQPLFLTIVEVEYEDGERDSYFLPLAICAAAEARGVEERSPHAVLARVTGARKGVLFDAWLDDGFGRALLEAFEQQQDVRIAARHAARRCRPAASRALRGEGPLDVAPAVRRAEQHVPRLRRSADPQAVPTPAARHQPRLRDRPAADRARRLSARPGGRRCPRIPDGRRSNRRPSR